MQIFKRLRTRSIYWPEPSRLLTHQVRSIRQTRFIRQKDTTSNVFLMEIRFLLRRKRKMQIPTVKILNF